MMNLNIKKKILIINTIAIFFIMFLFSNIYKWFPNFLTAAFFPVNESLYEHLKLMFVTQTLVSLITYLIIKNKKIAFNNYLFCLLISTVLTIFIFFLIYLPIYNRFGENLFLTMLIYLIVLIINQIIFYLINEKFKNIYLLEYTSLIFLSLIMVILIYFTFNPLKNDFFFDPLEEIYGIPNKS